MQPITILGVGRTDYEPKPGVSIPEMVHHAVQAALADAGLTMQDVDARVTASADLWDGLTASNVAITEVVGAVMQPEARVAGDGLAAACHGAMSILANAYNVVLVVAHCKASMGDSGGITNWTFDPIYQQPLGLDDAAAAALQSSALHFPTPPLPPPIADGAAAIILAHAPHPQSAIRDPQLIGMGWALDEHYLGDRDLTDSPALREAARRALALANLDDPKRDLTFVELSEHFDYQRELWTFILGLDSTHDINSSGGLQRGVPPFVAGLDRLIQVVLRLRQESGVALAHGCWGPCGQGQVVMVVRR
ncbi:MAG: hypothetical protein HY741_10535 [Chloroflexi bacterium]|nr:hypothetical protein [Chloroflexota bacterium]